MESFTVVFLLSLAVGVVGQILVKWVGVLTGHYFATRAPMEWILDNTLRSIVWCGRRLCYEPAKTFMDTIPDFTAPPVPAVIGDEPDGCPGL